jgi:hypothetical protein
MGHAKHTDHQRDGKSMKKKTYTFQELDPINQKEILPVFANHLNEILGPLEGTGSDFNPELIKYFIFKLEPLFTPEGKIVKISSKYDELTRDLYTKIFGGFHHETKDTGAAPEVM